MTVQVLLLVAVGSALLEAGERVDRAYQALTVRPIRERTVELALTEALHFLRRPRETGYAAADIRDAGDWKEVDRRRVEAAYPDAWTTLRVAGQEAWKLRIVLPERRSPFRRNGEAYLERVRVDFVIGETITGRVEKFFRRWLKPGEHAEIVLPYVVSAWEAEIQLATREYDVGKTVVTILARSGKVQDDPEGDWYHLVLLARHGLQSLKEDRLADARGFVRALHELMALRTGERENKNQ